MAYNAIQLINGVPTNVYLPGNGWPQDQYSVLSSNISSGSSWTLPGSMTYTLGVNALQVFVDGIRQTSGLDYTETSTTTITWQKNVNSGQKIEIRSP